MKASAYKLPEYIPLSFAKDFIPSKEQDEDNF